jgi:protein-S-isoprenylcysteine O-methyltransferase Ste14
MGNPNKVLTVHTVLQVFVFVRTDLEDRTWRRDFPGYKKYAQKTCFRLLPGVW